MFPTYGKWKYVFINHSHVRIYGLLSIAYIFNQILILCVCVRFHWNFTFSVQSLPPQTIGGAGINGTVVSGRTNPKHKEIEIIAKFVKSIKFYQINGSSSHLLLLYPTVSSLLPIIELDNCSFQFSFDLPFYNSDLETNR